MASPSPARLMLHHLHLPQSFGRHCCCCWGPEDEDYDDSLWCPEQEDSLNLKLVDIAVVADVVSRKELNLHCNHDQKLRKPNWLLLQMFETRNLAVRRRKTLCFFLYSSIVRNFSCSAWNNRTWNNFYVFRLLFKDGISCSPRRLPSGCPPHFPCAPKRERSSSLSE